MTNSKLKGSKAEREIVLILKDEGYQDVRRGQQYCGAEGNADVIGLNGIYIEVKRRLFKTISDWLHKASCEALKEDKGGYPVVFHRGDHEDWMVTMYFEHWINLYREWEAGQEGEGI